MNVAKRARELAKIYSLDEDKAYLVGILHDITKETDYAEQEKYMDNLGIVPTELEKVTNWCIIKFQGLAMSRAFSALMTRKF